MIVVLAPLRLPRGRHGWAQVTADVLIENDLRGNESHGVSNMLRQYVAWFRNGTHNPTPCVSVIREMPATALLDADNGLGIHIGPQARPLLRLALLS